MKDGLPLGLIGVGIAALLLSFAWTSIFPPGSGWTEEQSAELRAADDEIVDMYVKMEAAKRRGTQIDGEPPVYTKLLEKRTALRVAREKTEKGPANTARIFRYGGIGLVVVGAIANSMLKQK